ncbi:hypothetical protein GSI_14338 [Ganoderma sinense ZZ0214-1]|uniref:DUF6699 domain-containing protein n=1 Tax=Ganoderma sinense ZZ0214-1 TaxID=1077348 RepID=A0A2G8RNF4_9APHY|nr:hypothetical protein GSI_14338 [Ganoderma sinense ZZ0214-1]
MAQYYQSPVPFYYAVPVVWYVPSKPSSSTSSPIAQSHRRRHSSSSTPDVTSPSKRLLHSPHHSSYSLWPAGVPPTPELRTVPLPGVTSDAYATADERARYPSPVPPHAHGKSAVHQAPHPSLTQPSVDPFLAVLHHPNTRPPIVWDVMRHSSTAVLDHPSLTLDALRQRCAFKASRADGRHPLRSLVLIFPFLPTIQVEIVPSRASLRAGLHHISIWDVLEGLYYGLRAPISPHEFRTLGPSERDTLHAVAETRRRAMGESDSESGTVRRIDYLGRRRRFVGVRPALAYELPAGGRKLGEVFVVEVGTFSGAG